MSLHMGLHRLQYIIYLLMTCLSFPVTKGEFSLWVGDEQLPQDQSHRSSVSGRSLHKHCVGLLLWGPRVPQLVVFCELSRGSQGSSIIPSPALQHPLGWGPTAC